MHSEKRSCCDTTYIIKRTEAIDGIQGAITSSLTEQAPTLAVEVVDTIETSLVRVELDPLTTRDSVDRDRARCSLEDTRSCLATLRLDCDRNVPQGAVTIHQ